MYISQLQRFVTDLYTEFIALYVFRVFFFSWADSVVIGPLRAYES